MEKVSFSFRLARSLRDRAQAAADRDGRSLGSWIVRLIEAALGDAS